LELARKIEEKKQKRIACCFECMENRQTIAAGDIILRTIIYLY
jgi:hypothetical protein